MREKFYCIKQLRPDMGKLNVHVPQSLMRLSNHCSFSIIIFLLCKISFLLLPAPSFCKTQNTISILWKQPVDQPICLTMSPQGEYYGVVEKDGTVRFYSQHGMLIWKQEVAEATNLLIAKKGQSILVYSKLNPSCQYVSFYRKDGRRLWRHKVESSIWAGAVSPDGTLAAVTSGDRYVYVYKPDPERPSYRRWKLNGIGYQVVFSADSKRLIIGTNEESALVCYDIYGHLLWRCKYDENVRYKLSASAGGRTILGVLPGTPDDPRVELCIWNSHGKRLWKRSINAFNARALISPQSRYVAVSYARYLDKDDYETVERKIAVYSSGGRLLWEKGGLFFEPSLVALSPNGSSVIVSDGKKSLYNIDNRGKLLSKFTLPATIRDAISSDDGDVILLYCGNGWLYLLRTN